MGLIENDYRLLGQLFRHQVSYFGVEKVVVAVNYDVGMQDLQKQGRVMTEQTIVNNHNQVSEVSRQKILT